MDKNAYQHVSFCFSVHFGSDDIDSLDAKFQSVSGLDGNLETESIKEGGENRFEHVVPTRRKFGSLVLKRGVLGPKTSAISAWFKSTLEDEPVDNNKENMYVKVFDVVTIKLLGEENKPLMTWTATNVWPRSWKMGELNAERGEVLIETLELNYNMLLLSEEKAFNP